MITVSHGCYQGDPLVFLNWRVLLSRASGNGVSPMQIEEVTLLVPALHNIDLDLDKVMGVWDHDPEDVILVLLAHADDMGMIYPNHLLSLAARLDELIYFLPAHSEHPLNSPEQLSEVEMTKQFITGLLHANGLKEAITFNSED